MADVKPSRHVKAAHKHVKLKKHHARPYRKRHVGLLFFSLVALFVFGVVLVSYRDQIVGGFASSRGFVSDLFNKQTTSDVQIKSEYGYSLSYDQNQFYASGIDQATGNLHIGAELSQQRAYSVIRIAPTSVKTPTSTKTTASTALTFTYHPGGQHANEALDGLALKDGGLDATKLIRIATMTASIGGATFQKNTWQAKDTSVLNSTISPKFVTYSGKVKGDAVTIVINLGVGTGDDSAYQNILSSVVFNNSVGYTLSTPTNQVIAKVQSSRSLLDTLTNTGIAAAATNGVDLTGAEKVAALYSPAVVKIYNAYCMDIAVNGKAFVKDACDGTSGSGFFVSQNGYIGTNGHVAANNPLDIAITQAFNYYTTKGDASYINYLLSLTRFKNSDVPANATDTQALGIIFDALYTISPSQIVASNKVENLLVQVTAKNPDVATLLQDTQNRKTYSDASVLPATLAAADYRANDGYNGFKASDVAIIKVDGTNFPVTKLGSIDSVTQGADLSILGYPGNASDNGIVDSTSSEATLTTGKVSAKKNAEGSNKKLIETDTTIGHGNSGGPALDDNGDVVGIATYTADGSGSGNGTYNYIRDIQDLIDIAKNNNITFDTNSKTQAEWEKGIANFYTSHYSKALVSFKKVDSLYPNDSRVAEFTAAAQKRIQNGEDVVDFPIVPVIIIAAVLLLGVAAGVFLIIRHAKKHAIYNAGLAQGTVVPVAKGVPTQRVFVTKTGPTVDTPLVLSTAPGVAPQNLTTPAVAPNPPAVASASPVAVVEPVGVPAESVAQPSTTDQSSEGTAYGEGSFNPPTESPTESKPKKDKS